MTCLKTEGKKIKEKKTPQVSVVEWVVLKLICLLFLFALNGTVHQHHMKLEECHDDWECMLCSSFAQDLNLPLNKYSIIATLRKNAVVKLEDYFWKKSIDFFPPRHKEKPLHIVKCMFYEH